MNTYTKEDIDKMSYEDLKEQEEKHLRNAQIFRVLAEDTKSKEVTKDGVQAFYNYEFESSSGLTDEFARFNREYKKSLKKILKGYKLLNWNRGHFECSAFFQNESTDKIVYISCSDVRYFKNGWHNDILIREAEHEKDYTGGSNWKATLYTLKEVADKLTK